MMHAQAIEPVENVDKLWKHIVAVLDRIRQG
eukprot:CAMPEP_0116874098 /NCGR_PEP_ID=MMETSP0463-20121206/5496_1 /TAXON_ID=181622 /ORGANISM="Strombidinopsis sp, Strain SopsisLIS2011" /LENGTH=30 /DNA_ID= /DNA_START= /DNA_END= /DNA_ORIENTATION=